MSITLFTTQDPYALSLYTTLFSDTLATKFWFIQTVFTCATIGSQASTTAEASFLSLSCVVRQKKKMIITNACTVHVRTIMIAAGCLLGDFPCLAVDCLHLYILSVCQSPFVNKKYSFKLDSVA